MWRCRSSARAWPTRDRAQILVSGLAVGLLLTSCGTRLEEGQFACDPRAPDSCPASFFCQRRQGDDQYRCYGEERDFCGNSAIGPATTTQSIQNSK